MFAFARHLAELAVGITQLIHLLTNQLAPLAPAHGRELRPVSQRLSRALFRSTDLLQRLGSGATVTAGIETLIAYRNNSVISVLSIVARAAAGMSSGCSAVGDILETLDSISGGHPIEQERVTASIRVPEPNTTARTVPTIDVTYYIYIPDPTGEMESLLREAERAWAQFTTINSKLHKGANTSSDTSTSRTQSTATVPRNAEESAVPEALLDGSSVSIDGIADLVDMFRPVPTSVGNEDITAEAR